MRATRPRRTILSILFAVMTAASCKPHDPTKPTQASSGPGTFSVDPVTVVEKSLDVTVSLPGELTPYDSVEIYPRANGFIRKLTVDRGSVVKKGNLLAQLEAPELTSQRIEAEAKIAGDKSTLD